MNAEIAQRWIAALRSGEYAEGKGTLATSGKHPKHCPLGVLCELAAKEDKLADGTPLDRRKRANDSCITFDGRAGMLPPRVYRWAEMTAVNRVQNGLHGRTSPTLMAAYSYNEKHESRTIAEDSDAGATFAEIADIIEANWQTM